MAILTMDMNICALVGAFDSADIQFIPENLSEAGIRFRKRKPQP